MADREDVGADEHHGANDVAGERVAHARAVRADDVALELIEVFAGDADIREQADAGVDGVDGIVSGGEGVDEGARDLHAGDGVGGEVDVDASVGDGANIGNRQPGAVELEGHV